MKYYSKLAAWKKYKRLTMQSNFACKQADNHLDYERRRLLSMERRLRDTRQQLRKQTGSRDCDDVTSTTDDDGNVDTSADEAELQATLSQQQESADTQRRLVDDLEFNLLEVSMIGTEPDLAVLVNREVWCCFVFLFCYWQRADYACAIAMMLAIV